MRFHHWIGRSKESDNSTCYWACRTAVIPKSWCWGYKFELTALEINLTIPSRVKDKPMQWSCLDTAMHIHTVCIYTHTRHLHNSKNYKWNSTSISRRMDKLYYGHPRRYYSAAPLMNHSCNAVWRNLENNVEQKLNCRVLSLGCHVW